MSLNEKQSQLLGKWALESSENFDEYMQAIGINAIMRTIGNASKPNIELSVDGDLWTVKVESSFKSDIWTFKVGEKFKQTTIDGRKFWCIVELTEEGRIIERQSNIDGDSSVPSEITRFVENGKLIALSRAGDVESKRVYTRI